jgi:hypothetical protein
MMTFSEVLGTAFGFVAAGFMLYFPYFWCRRRNESEETYGLRWFMGKGAWRDALLSIVVTLVPLTFVSFYWPRSWGLGGPFRPSAWTAVNQLGGGLAAAFVEETFYRGWMQTLCVRKWGAYFAIFFYVGRVFPFPFVRHPKLAQAGDVFSGAGHGASAPQKRLRHAGHRLSRRVQRVGCVVDAEVDRNNRTLSSYYIYSKIV